MAISRGLIVVRDMSGIFQPLSLTKYLFLKGRQPLNHHISVCHLHSNDVLFTLSAWDHEDGALHYDLLHTTCVIIADNRHDTSSNPNAERCALDYDDVVPCQPIHYYFHVPDDLFIQASQPLTIGNFRTQYPQPGFPS
jgi:hypothetical protein